MNKVFRTAQACKEGLQHTNEQPSLPLRGTPVAGSTSLQRGPGFSRIVRSAPYSIPQVLSVAPQHHCDSSAAQRTTLEYRNKVSAQNIAAASTFLLTPEKGHWTKELMPTRDHASGSNLRGAEIYGRPWDPFSHHFSRASISSEPHDTGARFDASDSAVADELIEFTQHKIDGDIDCRKRDGVAHSFSHYIDRLLCLTPQPEDTVTPRLQDQCRVLRHRRQELAATTHVAPECVLDRPQRSRRGTRQKRHRKSPSPTPKASTTLGKLSSPPRSCVHSHSRPRGIYI